MVVNTIVITPYTVCICYFAAAPIIYARGNEPSGHVYKND